MLRIYTYRQLIINIDEDLHIWLIDVVLYNCIKNYSNRIGTWSKLESYLENTLLLLSVLNNSKEQTDKILDLLNDLVKNTHNTLQVFDEINLFYLIELYLLIIFSEFLSQVLIFAVTIKMRQAIYVQGGTI